MAEHVYVDVYVDVYVYIHIYIYIHRTSDGRMLKEMEQ